MRPLHACSVMSCTSFNDDNSFLCIWPFPGHMVILKRLNKPMMIQASKNIPVANTLHYLLSNIYIRLDIKGPSAKISGELVAVSKHAQSICL